MGILNRNILKFSSQAFGLDLSDLSVKVVQLDESGSGIVLRSFGSAQITPGSIIDGEIIKRENVVSSIKNAIEKSVPKKIKGKKVICSLPELKGFLRIISLPKMSEDEVREAIRWEIEANIPLSVDQVYYDWQILDKSLQKKQDKIDILMVAVSKKTIDQFVEVLELSGLEPMGLEIESVAQARSLVKGDGKNETTFIIDLGDRRTSFLILIDNVPCFTSSIPLSSQLMTDAISKTMSMPIAEAEKIKIQYGIGSPIKGDPIFKAVEPILENLVAEIERSMDFYLDELKYSSSVDKIIICGGGSKAKGIIPYLSKKIGKEITAADPWVNFEKNEKIPPIGKEESVQYSTAIGLALRGINK